MATSTTHIKRIAIAGASGNLGSHISDALLAAGTFTLTALTRHESLNTFYDAFDNIAKVDYENYDELVDALRGHDALIIIITTPSISHQANLVRAAADAGVAYILPNEWSFDTAADSPANRRFIDDIPIGPLKTGITELIRSLGKSKYISVVTGPWYDWCLNRGPVMFGLDVARKEMTFYDDGETRVSTTTLAQIGRAVVALLSLPVDAQNEGDRIAGSFLANYANKHIYIASFTISQKDVFQAVLRATGDSQDAWTVKSVDAVKRYDEGMEEFRKGYGFGLAKALSTRVFFKDECGNYEKTRGLSNGVLGLEKEDLDEVTAKSLSVL